MHRSHTFNSQWIVAFGKEHEICDVSLGFLETTFSIACLAVAAHIDLAHPHQKIGRES
jgi:hypothetical protein